MVNFSETSFVNKFSDCLSGRISKLSKCLPVSNIRFNSSKKIDGSFVNSYKCTVMELSQSEESQDSNTSGIKFIDTTNSDNEGYFGLSRDMDLTIDFCCSSDVDLASSCFLIVSFLLLDLF